MPLAPWFENEGPCSAINLILTEQRAHCTFENEAVLVLSGVSVQGCRKRAWRKQVLDDNKSTARFFSVDEEPVEHPQLACVLPILRLKDTRFAELGLHVAHLAQEGLTASAPRCAPQYNAARCVSGERIDRVRPGMLAPTEHRPGAWTAFAFHDAVIVHHPSTPVA